MSNLKENGRIVIMFCGFQGPPKIVRLHGIGEVIEPTHPDFHQLDELFPQRVGTRAYISVQVTRISDSCGYSIPHYEYQKDRDVLDKLCVSKAKEGLKTYRPLKTAESIDGIEGLREEA